MATRILVATRSSHKLRELQELLGGPARVTAAPSLGNLLQVELLSLDDLGIADEVEETGATFEANARLKARAYARLSGMTTLADDSGIEVDALGGRPGVHTRRYAGPDATDEQNNAKLLEELAGKPPEEREARYRCVLVLVEDGEIVETTEGEFEGRIADAPRGTGGFGYDPIFEPEAEPVGGRTVGQMTQEEKNRVSHRAAAAHAMRERLISRGY